MTANKYIDRDRILRKIAYIKEEVTPLNELLQNKTFSEILKDKWQIKGIKYSLQTSIEAMIDIAFHISSKAFNKAPVDGRDAFTILAQNGVLKEENLLTYLKMIAFRNKIVHGYQSIEDEKILEIAKNNISDFNNFINEILTFINN